MKRWAVRRWTLGPLHGVAHWERVERNGLLLATPECDVTVIRLFAYLHDSCRENDGYDLEHGPRAALMMESLRDNLLKDLSDEQFSRRRWRCSRPSCRCWQSSAWRRCLAAAGSSSSSCLSMG